MRREVLLLRHAIAAERDRLRWPDDALRPLTARGQRRFRQAAIGLGWLAGPPDEVWSSPLRRARETAEIATARAGWPGALTCVALRPGTSAATLAAKLAARFDEHPALQRIALVGHEPDLGRFIAWAIDAKAGAALTLRKGGAALLEFDGPVRAGRATLHWLATPRLLRALRRCVRR